MKIDVMPGYTSVIFEDHTGWRAKALFSIEGVSYGVIGLLVLYVAFAEFPGIYGSILAIISALVYGIIFWRYLSRVTRREELLIYPDFIKIINIVSGRKMTDKYFIEKIASLHFIGFEKPIDHPLKSETFDYFGFQTQQYVVNSVMAEGNLGFRYEGRIIRFGIGVPSWDAAALDELLKQQTSGKLSVAGLPDDIPATEWNEDPVI